MRLERRWPKKWLKPGQKSGIDCLECAEFARQRTLKCPRDTGSTNGQGSQRSRHTTWKKEHIKRLFPENVRRPEFGRVCLKCAAFDRIHDRTGISEIQPDKGVETEYGGPAEEDPYETEVRVVWGYNPVWDDRSDFTQSRPLSGDCIPGGEQLSSEVASVCSTVLWRGMPR